jgi:hypothetical protein
VAALALGAAAAPAGAIPLRLSCVPVDKDRAAMFGRLAVEVDLEARTVAIEAEKYSGYLWVYRDGATASTIARTPPEGELTPPRRQFVIVTPSLVMFGWREIDDGEITQLTSFDRAAILRRGAPCHWRNAWGSKIS